MSGLTKIFCKLLWLATLIPNISHGFVSKPPEEKRTSLESNQFFNRGAEPAEVLWIVDDVDLSEAWEGWLYDFETPAYLSATSGKVFYGFGVWQPRELDNMEIENFGDASDWLLGQGVNVSFSTEYKDNEPRYRLDVRWHEDYDTELLLQMQFPIK